MGLYDVTSSAVFPGLRLMIIKGNLLLGREETGSHGTIINKGDGS